MGHTLPPRYSPQTHLSRDFCADERSRVRITLSLRYRAGAQRFEVERVY
jgi:hypothetical protein